MTGAILSSLGPSPSEDAKQNSVLGIVLVLAGACSRAFAYAMRTHVLAHAEKPYTPEVQVIVASVLCFGMSFSLCVGVYAGYSGGTGLPDVLGGGPGIKGLGEDLHRPLVLICVLASLGLGCVFDLMCSVMIQNFGGDICANLKYSAYVPFFIGGCVIFADMFTVWQVRCGAGQKIG